MLWWHSLFLCNKKSPEIYIPRLIILKVLKTKILHKFQSY
uniref:Uncharacterized protein n=1 Tax=Firmicutes phage HS17 TaxID=3056395 RepID=A0AA49X4D9_9VIRU|nr:MAG: hypothetical protein [Firmicutes phage HS17]